MARVTGLLAGVLERRRESFNARFVLAKRELPNLSGEAVLDFLEHTMPPLVEAVQGVAPEAVDGVCERLYTVALPLLAKDLIGGRSPALTRVWRELLPALPTQLAAEPELLSRALSNAMFALESQPSGRPAEWAASMLALAPHAANTRELLEAGKLLAWRAGLAQYRTSALAVAAGLPPALTARALGLPDPAGVPATLLRLRADPWADPARPSVPGPRIQARIGGFRGLGGPFLCPPRVAMTASGLVATDGHTTFTLHADRFGWACLMSPAPFPEREGEKAEGLWGRLSRALNSAPGAPLSSDGTVTLGGVSQKIPEFNASFSFATDGQTLAATNPHSHFVWLVAAGPP